MSNNKKKPAAGKSVAGKTNSKKNNAKNISQRDRQKQRAQAEKDAKRLIEEKQKAQKQKQKKSEEIRKRREKESEKQQKTQQKTQSKNERKDKRRHAADIAAGVWEKVKYYTSKDFLNSFNYVRIFIFIVVPTVLVVLAAIGISKTVFLNVPTEIRTYEYNSRLESELTAKESVFNAQQQQVFIEALNASGSRKFEFYINSVIPVDDDGATKQLCFGNPNGNDIVLVATVYGKDGEIIYRSLGLEGGKELNEAKLFTSLSYGLHDVKVAVNAYDKQTNEKIGTRYAKIRLAVGVDENGK